MTPLSGFLYEAGQLGRSAWYLGHAMAASRLSTPIMDALPKGLPDRRLYLDDLRALLRRDRLQIQAGRYRRPDSAEPDGQAALRRSTRFLADLGRINLRRLRKDGQEVFRDRGKDPAKSTSGRPRYYLQNFHYQTDGWLSDHSAELYDFQVDVLFNGATDAMRRQALLPIADFCQGRRIADLRLVDIACGTGRFLAGVKQNFPRLPVTGVDLSPAYLDKTREKLAARSWWALLEANAERLPLGSASADLVTSVYLLHELPEGARRRVVLEMARILKPGGRLVLVDSIQYGDHEPFDALLGLFPVLYHEPYYENYANTDLVDLFESAGLKHCETDRAFMSKILVFDKPDH